MSIYPLLYPRQSETILSNVLYPKVRVVLVGYP